MYMLSCTKKLTLHKIIPSPYLILTHFCHSINYPKHSKNPPKNNQVILHKMTEQRTYIYIFKPFH